MKYEELQKKTIKELMELTDRYADEYARTKDSLFRTMATLCTCVLTPKVIYGLADWCSTGGKTGDISLQRSIEIRDWLIGINTKLRSVHDSGNHPAQDSRTGMSARPQARTHRNGKVFIIIPQKQSIH